MKFAKFTLASALVAAFAQAHALSVTVTLDNIDPTIAAGSTYEFTGTIKYTGVATLSILSLANPYNSTGDSLSSVIDGLDFYNYFITHPSGGSFTGNLFHVTASNTQTPAVTTKFLARQQHRYLASFY